MENKNKNEAVEIIIDWASSGRNNSIYIYIYMYLCMYVCMYRIIVKEWTLHAQRMLKLPAYI